ncbi:hypothetical protein quinque_004351 [Culex quinquefasciatus]
MVLGRICLKDVSVQYLKRGTTRVSRTAKCYYTCIFASHTRIVDSSYTAQTCELASKTELRSECCDGYAKNSRGECLPVCEGGCINGTCNAPNQCGCAEGYQLRGNRCLPVCDVECVLGVCTSPGQCTCLPGYTKQTDTECAPVCETPCENGRCIAPNTCECDHGFEKYWFSDYQCFPKCDPTIADCSYGTCVAPNRCRCAVGFVFRGHRCVPQCDTTCVNGDCTSPNRCTCKEGFSTSSGDSNVCVPICASGCQHGTCVGPNTCQCSGGYNATSTDPNLCEPSCDPTHVDVSNGKCIAPNVLRCSEGYVLERSSGLMRCRSSVEGGQEIPTDWLRQLKG